MRRRLLRGRLPAVAAVFVCATTAAAQQTPDPYRAHDIEVYHGRSLDAPATVSGDLDGVYALTSVSGQRLPVSTPSSYGVLRGAMLIVRGDRYVLVYRYGGGERLRIDGRLAYDQSGRVEFRPTTPGIPAALAHYTDGQIVSVVDGGFGMRNARFVFTLQDGPGGGRGPAPGGWDRPDTRPTPSPDDREPSPRPWREPEPEPSPVASCPAARAGNLVEPLSNGLLLSWDVKQIREQFGAGQSSWDARTITFNGFRVAVGGREDKIWHLHLTAPGACLNSGIAYGSTRAEVQRVFGASYGTTYGQYKLTFSYDGDRLVDIGIDPADRKSVV